MAYISSHPHSPLASVGHAISVAANAVFNFLADITNADARLRAVEALQAMSDEELMSRYHIKRDEIVAHVFRDKMMF